VVQGGTLRARQLARTASISMLGVGLLGVALFAIFNVAVIEQWGSSLGRAFEGSRPVPLPIAIVTVFLAGVVTSLTPCVYPVVPLAVTYLGARGATSRIKAFSLAASYVLGMVLCYTILGALAALTGTTFGTATQRWWVYAGVATVVLAFGLSMFGLFDLRLPGWLTRIATPTRGPGYQGAFLMGGTSGLVTAPCTAPVLGALLPIISRQSVPLGSLLLATFALGMGMLFLIVGTYSGVIGSMPRSGRWMGWVKAALGTAIVLVAGYFYYQAYLMLPIGRGGGNGSGLEGARPAGGVVGRTEPPGPGAREEWAVLLAADRHRGGDPQAPPPPAGSSSNAPGAALEAAPEFELTDVGGKRHTLGAYRGKTVHLYFLALWCPPCMEQLRQVETAAVRLRSRGYRAIGIALKERETEAGVRDMVAQRQVGFPVAWDRSGSAAAAFGVDSVPAHVIVGPRGTILYRGGELPDGFERDGAGLLSP
jgi:thiol:disulfide interchange protein DsbD